MGPKKVTHENIDEQNYPALLKQYCQEEDVLIIPEFVVFTRNQFRSSSSRKKSGDYQERENISTIEIPKADEVMIIYETTLDKDYPVTVFCKNFYIEPAFINAFGRSLKFFPTIESLKIEHCCISQDLAKILALRLAEDAGKQISDLSLDGNPDISHAIPLFIILPNGLKSLSVERCGIDNEAVKLLGLSLEYSSLKGSRLKVLNLGLNKITDTGVSYLANALRINRTLNSLSLLGNQIGDEGISFLADVLQEFSLTDEEVFCRKRKIFQGILHNQNIVKIRSSIKEGDRSTSKPGHSVISWRMHGRSSKNLTFSERSVNPVSKISASRSFHERKKNKSNISRIAFSNRHLINEKEEVIIKFSDLKFLMKDFPSYFAQEDIVNSIHPFTEEVFIADNKFHCPGCWSLLNLNLAYNYLTEKSIEKLIKVVQYQHNSKEFAHVGLTRVILVPGNLIPESSSILRTFRNILSHKKKEID